MSEKSERAKELFRQGYNCSQAVFCTFCEELGIDFETGLKLSSSFGGGMGKLREVCGTVSAMFMAAGLKYGYTDPKDNIAKAEHYKLIQQLAEKFTEENGSIVCRDLLGLRSGKDTYIPTERNDKFYTARPCIELVGYAAELTEEMLKA